MLKVFIKFPCRAIPPSLSSNWILSLSFAIIITSIVQYSVRVCVGQPETGNKAGLSSQEEFSLPKSLSSPVSELLNYLGNLPVGSKWFFFLNASSFERFYDLSYMHWCPVRLVLCFARFSEQVLMRGNIWPEVYMAFGNWSVTTDTARARCCITNLAWEINTRKNVILACSWYDCVQKRVTVIHRQHVIGKGS